MRRSEVSPTWSGGDVLPRTDVEYLSVKGDEESDMISPENEEEEEEEEKVEELNNNQLNPVKQWCKNHHLQYKTLQMAWNEAKRVKNRFERLILARYRNGGADPDVLFDNHAPSNLKGNDNLLMAVAQCNMNNFAKRTDGNSYIVCGNAKRVSAKTSENRRGFTFMDPAIFGTKFPDNAVLKLFQIFGNTKLLTFNAVSEPIMKEL